MMKKTDIKLFFFAETSIKDSAANDTKNNRSDSFYGLAKQQTQEGFTLLEVMIAMTLLSIMVVLLFSSLKVGAESWDKGESKIAEVNEKAVVYQFFKRHLPATRPLWDDFSGDERVFSFQGGRDKLQFISVFPASASRIGIQLFEVRFDDADNGRIIVSLKPFYPTTTEEGWEREDEVLLEGVEEFKVEYYEKLNPYIEGVWQEGWYGKESLPALIKIKIVLKDHGYWPEMVFEMKLSSPDTFSITGA